MVQSQQPRDPAEHGGPREVPASRFRGAQGQASADEQRQLVELRRELETSHDRNRRLAQTLSTARDELARLKGELERIAQPPNTHAVFLAVADDDKADVVQSGRRLRVAVSPQVDLFALQPGQQVLLSEALVVIEALGVDRTGEIATLKELLPGGRALISGRSDDELVVWLAGSLRGETLRPGDALTYDARAGYAYEKIPKSEVESLVLEEVPDIRYTDIGGLGPQIEQIEDAVELPFLHPDLYREHGLKAPKGILLYGPPGCGKTLIAKAVANSLARRAAEKAGIDATAAKSYFLNIKGPELLNKYVGETERSIRLIFSRAREKASQGTPVVVFFDEMESLFRTRGTGVSSDVETTIVPQLLSEIDGVETLDNVIVIGASNREDMIDPAILRPGRLDVKVKIERPDAEAALDIFAKYLTPDLPLHPSDLTAHDRDRRATVEAMIQATVEKMYAPSEENEFIEVTYVGGDKETLYFKDFASGAMIQNVVDRAKKQAIKELLASGVKGLRIEHLFQAVSDEFREHEDLPNTTNPDDWAKISGRKGEKIVYLRTIMHSKNGSEPGRTIDTVGNTGQYL